MQTINRLDSLRTSLAALRREGTLALVPTMGALHAGHLALVEAAKARAAHVVVSIFVNPRQFGANEDLGAYPRDLERDVALLTQAGVSLLWAPDVQEVYPHGFATNISVSGLADTLCGAARPGHFDGVATVVTKLFHQVQPDIALFGEKDWQQLQIIRRMARDLDMTHPYFDQIIGVGVVRESDGLALSSRNAYLTPVERLQAANLPRAMNVARANLGKGESAAIALATLRQTLLTQGFASVDYADLCDAETLAPRTAPDTTQETRLLVAARIGKARLIDNLPVPALTTSETCHD